MAAHATAGCAPAKAMSMFDPGPYAVFCPPAEPDKWERIREIAAGFGFIFD